MELWHLITLLLAFFGCIAGFGKLLLTQIDRRLDERFAAQESAREQGQQAWRRIFDEHLETDRRETEVLHALEKDFLRFQGNLPLHYVRREDHIRNQTTIEAKLDGLALKLENIQLKGRG